MLFFYTPLQANHNIENLNLYYEFFFENLFKNEPPEINELIHSDFEDIFNNHKETIRNKLENLHICYIHLKDSEKEIVQNAFRNNREIEQLCNKTIDPIKYTEIPILFRNDLKALYDESWTLLTNKYDEKNKKIKEKCGNIYEHYCEFFKNNRQNFSICPVCGLENILSEFHACSNPNEPEQKLVREAYDHYFPKAIYPFISVEFSNLIPICGHCNSDYKHVYDTAYNFLTNQRQKCFFPFSDKKENDIQISLLNVKDLKKLNISDIWNIEIKNKTGGDTEEISSWDRIFDIKSRYKKYIKQKEVAWKEILLKKVKRKKWNEPKEDFLISLYDDISITDQPGAIVQKIYYDYFIENLLDGYLEE
jgi:hypothetical protein